MHPQRIKRHPADRINWAIAHKKRGPLGPLLGISSWLNAFDVGSPHIVFWTVCSPGAFPTLLGWRPQLT